MDSTTQQGVLLPSDDRGAPAKLKSLMHGDVACRLFRDSWSARNAWFDGANWFNLGRL